MLVPQLSLLIDALCVIAAVWLVFKISRNFRRRLYTTSLRGPPSPSFLWGASHIVSQTWQTGGAYEQWAEMYGAVFKLAAALGTSRLVITDPKAATHVFLQDTWGYSHTAGAKSSIEAIVNLHGCSWYTSSLSADTSPFIAW